MARYSISVFFNDQNGIYDAEHCTYGPKNQIRQRYFDLTQYSDELSNPSHPKEDFDYEDGYTRYEDGQYTFGKTKYDTTFKNKKELKEHLDELFEETEELNHYFYRIK